MSCDQTDLKAFFKTLRTISHLFLFGLRYMMDLSNAMVVSLMAYEHYIMVCKPFEYQITLSFSRRLRNYSTLIAILLLVTILFTVERIIKQFRVNTSMSNSLKNYVYKNPLSYSEKLLLFLLKKHCKKR